MPQAAAHPKKRSPWRRLIFWTVLLLCAGPIALAAGILFFADRIDPDRFRTLLVERVNRTITGELTIGTIDFGLSGSLVFENISIIAPETFQHRNAAHVDRLSISWWPVALLSKTVELRRIDIVNPDFDVEKRADGKINLLEAIALRSPSPSTTSPGSPFIRADNDRLALNLPVLPVAVRIGALVVTGFDATYLQPGFGATAGPIGAELSGHFEGGRVRLYHRIDFAGHENAKVEFHSDSFNLNSQLTGGTQVRFDSAEIGSIRLLAGLKLENTQIFLNGKSLSPGDTSVDIRNADIPGEFDIEFAQSDFARADISLKPPLTASQKVTLMSAHSWIDGDRMYPLTASAGILHPVRKGRISLDAKGIELRHTGSTSVAVGELSLLAEAARFDQNGLSVLQPSIALHAKQFEWVSSGSPQTGGLVLKSGDLPIELHLKTGPVRRGRELRTSGIRLNGEVRSKPEGLSADITASVDNFNLLKPDALEPVIAGNPLFIAGAKADLSKRTIILERGELDIPDFRYAEDNVLSITSPVTTRFHGQCDYGQGVIGLLLDQLKMDEWFDLKGEASLNYIEPVKPFDMSAVGDLDLTRFAHVVEPVRDGVNVQPLGGQAMLTFKANGNLAPMSVYFTTGLRSHAFTEEPVNDFSVDKIDFSSDVSGSYSAKGGLTRLLGHVNMRAEGISGAGHKIGGLNVSILLKPEDRAGIIRAALELQTQGVIVKSLGNEPVPDLSLWLRFLADLPAKSVTGISMPFTLKDTLSAAIEGDLQFAPRKYADLRLKIEPVSVPVFIRRLPETVRQSLGKYKPSGTVTADLSVKGPFPGPEFLVTGDYPFALNGKIDLTGTSLIAGSMEVRNLRFLTSFDRYDTNQKIRFDVTAGEMRLPGIETSALNTVFSASASFENLNDIVLETVSLVQPTLGFRLDGSGALDRLFSSPKGNFRTKWALDAKPAARLFGFGIDAEGQLKGELFANALSSMEVDLFGGIELTGINVKRGRELELSALSGPVNLSSKVRLKNGKLELLPVRIAAKSAEAQTLLERRLKSAVPETKPLRIASVRWNTARVENFSGWASIEGGTFRLRSVEAAALEGNLVADMTASLYPEPEVWIEGNMSRMNMATLMKDSSSGDYVVNQNLNVRINKRGDLTARFNITRIGKEAMDGLLDLLDPSRSDPKFKRLRELLGWGLIPDHITMEAANGLLDLNVTLQSRIVWDPAYFFQSAFIRMMEPLIGRSLLDQPIPRIPISGILDNMRSQKVAYQ